MESNPINKDQADMNVIADQTPEIPIKKNYTPPALIVYGKLTELTAAGSGTKNENYPDPPQRQRP